MTDVSRARPFGIRDLLRLPDYRRLFAAQAISDLGDGMTYLALFLLVLELTGSAAALALVSILVALPPVTVGLFAGAFADRHDRRRIMLVADTLRAAVVAALVLVATPAGLPVLFALAGLQSLVGTFFSPSRAAMIPRVVPTEGLLAANSLSQMTRMIAGVLGAGATGLIAGLAGVVWPAFLFDAATFMVSVALVYGVSRTAGIPDPVGAAATRARGIMGAVGEGLRLIANSRPLLATLGGISVTMLGIGAVNVLFIPFLVTELGESPLWAGPLEGAETLSMILASGLVATLAARLRVSTLVVVGIAGTGSMVAALAAVGSAWALLAVMFAVGWFVMPVQAATMTLLQQWTTDAIRGRVAGAFNAAMSTASILSMAAAGILADSIGMRNVFLIGGGVGLAGALVAWLLFRGAPAPATPRAGEAAPIDEQATAAA